MENSTYTWECSSYSFKVFSILGNGSDIFMYIVWSIPKGPVSLLPDAHALPLTYNYFHNILRLSLVLPNFSFTTSKTMRDYYL